MGCVSSAFLEEGAEEDGRRRIISHHHIVSLTSSTYGILNYPSCSSASPPPPIGPPPLPTAASLPPPPPPPPPPPTNLIKSGPQQQQQEPEPEPEEVINSWELMAGLLDPSTPGRPPLPPTPSSRRRRIRFPLRPIDGNARPSPAPSAAAVLYTTSLRGVRSTFEACNAVRAALQAHGVAFRERDVSMDRGFREELRDLLLSPSSYACGSGSGSGSGSTSTTTTKRKVPSLPRLFVRGRHVGGAEEVLRLDEQGLLAPLLEGLPRARGGTYCCDGCGGMRFLPCFDCSGSRKLLLSSSSIPAADNSKQQQQQGWNCSRRRTVVVRCGECNENGLVLCPICS